MKHVPAWLPGAGFKRTAAAWRDTLTATINKPYHFVRRQMKNDKYPQSYLSNLMEGSQGETPDAEEEQMLKYTAASLYTGGADTVCHVFPAPSQNH